MSFSGLADKFSPVFDKSPYQSQEPLVRLQFVQRGNNIVVGRTIKAEDFSNLIFIGKVFENTVGRNYLSADVWLDTTFPHVVYITGTRGSGKSFDLGVILEGISALSDPSAIQNESPAITSILIDTQSQFWTLKYPPNPAIPENKHQLNELSKWNIRGNSLKNCKLFLPEGHDKITGDEEFFSIRADQIKAEEWCALIKEETYSPQGHIISKTVEQLRENFDIADMQAYISDQNNWPGIHDSARSAVLYKLDDYRRTGLFSKHGLQLSTLLVPGQCNIFLLRDLRNEDKSLVTSFIARGLFTAMGAHHKKLKVDKFFNRGNDGRNLPSRVWLLIDEAHVVAPSDAQSPARDALVEYVKRGRDAGLSLVLATQQPSAIDDRILSQVNVTLSHRLSFQADINAAINRIPTKLLGNLKLNGVEIREFGDMLRFLDSGECFLGDHNSSRTIMIKVRPRVTSHGGYSPI